MIAPEAPTGGAIRQAVLDDKADGGIDDASGVVTAGFGQVGGIRCTVESQQPSVVMTAAVRGGLGAVWTYG